MRTPNESLETVRVALEATGHSAPSAPILAAVSGGADSVALLYMFHELEVPAVVAHFNHRTRGPGSDQDAFFVQSLADDLGLKAVFGEGDVAAMAEASPESFETVARELRYQFLTEAAEEHGCCALATGHHSDDQAETLLMRIIRGTSPRGLAGIPVLGERDGFEVVRPLIQLSREDIQRYVADRGLQYRDDPSNTDMRFDRNRIRHQLLPRLVSEYNPNVREALERLANLQRDENDFMREAADAFLLHCRIDSETIERKAFRFGHPAIQRRALLQIAWEHGADPDYDHVQAAIEHITHGDTGQFCDLGAGVQLCNGKEDSLIMRPERRRFRARTADLAIPGETSILGRRISARLLETPPPESLGAYCRPTRQVFDGDRLGHHLSVRTVRDGDRFEPFGLGGTKKLGDYFTDIGLPVPERPRQVVLEAKGRIVWVLGHAIAEHAAVTRDTQHYVEVEVGGATE